jgi:hypothetical protein
MRIVLLISVMIAAIGCEKTVREARLQPAQPLVQPEAVAVNHK